MSTKVQIRRGSTSSANAFTGAEGELYVDTDQNDLRVHNGSTPGGFRLPNFDTVTELNSSKVDKIDITAGTVGSGSAIPVITYNEQGQITAVSTSTLNIPANIATETYVNNQISSLINGAPGALDTLKELATALGNDSSFATTITNQLALKANTSSLATVATTGSYNDLTNKPNLLGVNSNIVPFFDFAYNLGSTVNQWGQVYAYNINTRRIVFPSNGGITINGSSGSANSILKRVSSGDGVTWSTLSYDELTDKPFIPNLTSQLMNDAGFVGNSGGTISGLLTTQEITEVINTKTNATGVVVHDFSTGSIWYHSNISGNFTPNFTNVPTTDNRSTVVTLILNQTSTVYIPSAIQINGVEQTIKWLGANAPFSDPQVVNIISFVMIRVNNSWSVLGSLSLYG